MSGVNADLSWPDSSVLYYWAILTWYFSALLLSYPDLTLQCSTTELFWPDTSVFYYWAILTLQCSTTELSWPDTSVLYYWAILTLQCSTTELSWHFSTLLLGYPDTSVLYYWLSCHSYATELSWHCCAPPLSYFIKLKLHVVFEHSVHILSALRSYY